jgi:hypothetical protein
MQPVVGKSDGLMAVALALLLLSGALTFLVDVTTIRADPSVFPYDFASARTAFPGELISVRLGQDWTEIVSSNTEVVRPLAVSTNPSVGRFIAVQVGQAILQASSAPRCPRCELPDVLWRMTVTVTWPAT